MSEDLDAFLAELGAAHPGKGKYLPIDRYRDFRQVFLATEPGKRVLHEILSWGHLYRASAVVGRFDPYRTMFHDGERNVALKTMAAINIEPSQERPVRANSTEPRGD